MASWSGFGNGLAKFFTQLALIVASHPEVIKEVIDLKGKK